MAGSPEIDCGIYDRDTYVRLFANMMVVEDLSPAETWQKLKSLGLDSPWVKSKTGAANFARNPEVKAQIEATNRAHVEEKTGITEEALESLLSEIAYANAADIVEIQQGGLAVLKGTKQGSIDADEANKNLKRYGRLIRNIKNGTRGVEIQLHDKKWAFDFLTKQFQRFSTKMEHAGKDGADLPPVVQLFNLDFEKQSAGEGAE